MYIVNCILLGIRLILNKKLLVFGIPQVYRVSEINAYFPLFLWIFRNRLKVELNFLTSYTEYCFVLFFAILYKQVIILESIVC